MLYKVLKRSIERGGYDKDVMLAKLTVFREAGRISQAEFDELFGLIQVV